MYVVMHEACLGALALVSSVCELVWLLTHCVWLDGIGDCLLVVGWSVC